MLPGSANTWLVLLGTSLLGLGAGVVGVFAFLRRRSLLGDALAHAALPGVCAAFLLTGARDPLVLLAGAAAACLLGALTVDAIVRWTRVREDSALAIVLSVYFAAGIFLLTGIQKSGAAAQGGLDRYLFGQAASLVDRDVAVLAGLSALLLACVALAWKEFKVLSFDPVFAATLGLPVRSLQAALATLLVLAVAVGLSAVGVVLMAAMLVTPAAAARLWTDRLPVLVLLAGLFGAASGASGTLLSASSLRMPTGPWMVLSVSTIFLLSLGCAPGRGLLAVAVARRRRRRKTLRENLLRTLYRLGEEDGRWDAPRPAPDLLARRPMPRRRLEGGLRGLRRRGFAARADVGWALTPRGLGEARRITRLHRLWELYLARQLEIAPDHVHGDAEEIEHVLTPEMEARLLAILGDPETDPHARTIPPAPRRGAPTVEGR